jgi:hypothetical protein
LPQPGVQDCARAEFFAFTFIGRKAEMLKLKIAMSFLGLLSLASGVCAQTAVAQTKIAGTIQCAKPDPLSAVPVGDKQGHMFILAKARCTWTKPLVIAGVATKTAEDADYAEARGAKTRDSGYHLSVMDNNDSFLVRFIGASRTGQNGAVLTQTGRWSFVSGTGKIKGIAGKGTYKGTGAADGTVTTDIEGEYQIAAK